MIVSLAELAETTRGVLVGDGNVAISGAATLEQAGTGEITFIDSADKLGRLTQSQASAAVVPRGVVPAGLSVIQADNVADAFARIVCHFRPRRDIRRIGISPRATVSESARIGIAVDIHPCATVGDQVEIGDGSTIHAGVHIMAGCRIGEHVTIFPNAILYEDTVVGDRTMIHAGAVLGAYGFGYLLVGGRHQPSAQLGFVEVGADVEIGAGTTIDRGTYGPTVIGEGTKIDNLVMIAHNCRLGRHNLICSQVGIAGSTITGEYVVMAGQVGVRDHVSIGDRAVLGAKAGVPNDVPADTMVFGIPARPEREQKLIYASIAKLPEMRRQLKVIESKLAALGQGNALESKSGKNAA